jgi:hypothetical protein
MKALSLWQPWASLIAIGAKRYETRSWPTRYRGPLLICAAKTMNREVQRALLDVEIQKAMVGAGITIIPFGMAVCLVDLVGCYPTEAMSKEQIGADLPFGDFTPGRYAWKLEDLRKVPPFAVNGKQGLFDVPLMPGEIYF